MGRILIYGMIIGGMLSRFVIGSMALAPVVKAIGKLIA